MGAARKVAIDHSIPVSQIYDDKLLRGLEQIGDDLAQQHIAVNAASAHVQPAQARTGMLDFTRYTFHGFEESWHHGSIAEFLDRFVAGEITRGMIFMPPRHSKSEFVSRRLPAYIFGKRPSAKIIAASYTHDLAVMMSRDVQRIIETPAYENLFPNTRILGKQTDPLWEINNGQGYYRAAGVNVGISGMGASYGLIDDPIKDAAEANSQVYRENLWQWYTSTFYTRLEMPGSILLTMTRWHEDDLAGRLLKIAREDPQADQWTVLDLPARAIKNQKNRKQGEPLWPSRFGDERLMKIERTLGDWWDPMYQQRPGKPGGTMFKRHWFEVVDHVPSGWMGAKFVRRWDVAGTAGGGDWTVGTLMAELSYVNGTKLYVILSVIRGQWDSGGVNSVIQQTAKTDREKWGFVRIREEQEPGSSGKAVINQHKQMLAGYDYAGVPTTGEKTINWAPFAAMCKTPEAETGSVKLLRGPWNFEWLEEMVRVPKAAHDDQADSAAGAFNDLTGAAGGVKITAVSGY